MKEEQSVKRGLIALKEQSVTLRNRMEAEKDPHAKRLCRLRYKSSKFWERLTEGLIFVLLLAILSGCNIARETMHLGGAACQDVAWLLEKGAENIQTQEK